MPFDAYCDRMPNHDGAAIRRLRTQQGWKVVDLAHATGISHSHLVNIEAGRRTPSDDTLTALAINLGVPVHALEAA